MAVREPAHACDVAAQRSGTASGLRRVHNWTIRLEPVLASARAGFCFLACREHRELGRDRRRRCKTLARPGREQRRPVSTENSRSGKFPWHMEAAAHPVRGSGREFWQFRCPVTALLRARRHERTCPRSRGSARRSTQARVRRALGHPKSSSAHRTRRHAADQVSARATGLASLVSIAACGEAGNCSTFARWPSHKRVSSTIWPPGNSSAS